MNVFRGADKSAESGLRVNMMPSFSKLSRYNAIKEKKEKNICQKIIFLSYF